MKLIEVVGIKRHVIHKSSSFEEASKILQEIKTDYEDDLTKKLGRGKQCSDFYDIEYDDSLLIVSFKNGIQINYKIVTVLSRYSIIQIIGLKI